MAAVQSAKNQLEPRLLRIVAIIIVTHVTMVWAVHYQWRFSEATRDGYAGFILFHAALLSIVTSVFVPARRARNLIIGAFAIVTLGAVGAVFKFEVVTKYRIPVIIIAITGMIGLVQAVRMRSARAQAR